RPVQGHLRPDGIHARSQRRRTKPLISGLQLLDVLTVPPDQHVGVGAQARDVVRASHDDVLAGELGEQVIDLRGHGRTVCGAQGFTQPEDRPHGVADHLIELPGIDPRRRFAHDPILTCCAASSSTTLRAAARAEATHAATPTPSYSAPQTARPGVASTAARIRATRSTWPTVYCGNAPPQRVTLESTGVPDKPVASRRSASTPVTRSASSRCSSATWPCRPIDARSTTRSPLAAPSHGHFTDEYVTALTNRPSTGGTRKPDVDGRVGKAERGRARVTMAMLAASTPANSAAAAGHSGRSSRAAGAAGTAITTASTSSTSGLGTGPLTTRHPSALRCSSRTVTPVRSVAALAAATASGRRPTPPRSPAKTGPATAGAAARTAATAAPSDRCRRTCSPKAGTVASSDNSSARPAYTPPSSGSTRRSATAGPNRSRTSRPMAMSPSIGMPGSCASAAARAISASSSTPPVAS